MNSVVFQSRGINGTRLLNPRLPHPLNFEDYKLGLEEVKAQYPGCELYTVGFSMGGNYLIRLLGEDWFNSQIKAAVVVSPPISINSAVDQIKGGLVERHFINIYRYQTITNKPYRKMIKTNEIMLKKMEILYGYEMQKILRTTDLRSLHQEFSVPVFKEKDVYTLFEKYDITKEHIANIKGPLLMLHSIDDNICDIRLVPKEEIAKNPNIFYAQTQSGGHVCWLSGDFGSAVPVNIFWLKI
jgi:predicted alpha/beta-fold hydrolase